MTLKTLHSFTFCALFAFLFLSILPVFAQDNPSPSMPMGQDAANENEIDPSEMIAIEQNYLPSDNNNAQAPYTNDVNINYKFNGDVLDTSSILDAYKSFQVLRPDEPMPSEIRSFLFTTWQYALLQEAKREFLTRDPNAADLTQDETPPEERPRGIRELSLSGILFTSADRWIVWLNGMRVTPEAIPEQVIDIKVNNKFVELLWYDGFTQLIYPVRLRPHQRFNLDARMFLPGAAPL